MKFKNTQNIELSLDYYEVSLNLDMAILLHLKESVVLTPARLTPVTTAWNWCVIAKDRWEANKACLL